MLYCGDCLEVMRGMESETIDAIVTDPPYGISFMGKEWDHGVPGVEFWAEALRVAKPGTHMLAFGGTRTFHRLTCAIEDAGWEIRDCVMWVYGSGFPKSHNLSDKWQGWGTALKPAWEPIVLARKPLIATVVENVLKYGTGAINIDGCRIGEEKIVTKGIRNGTGNSLEWSKSISSKEWQGGINVGRFPANVIHDGSDEVLQLFPESNGQQGDVRGTEQSYSGSDDTNCYGIYGRIRSDRRGDSGSAARFFYCAKASKADRNHGLNHMPKKAGGMISNTSGQHITRRDTEYEPTSQSNIHPTVKPVELMRYLCRLITPPNGIVLDPFMGSGSTGVAALQEGFNFTGIEINKEYFEIARERIKATPKQGRLFETDAPREEIA